MVSSLPANPLFRWAQLYLRVVLRQGLGFQIRRRESGYRGRIFQLWLRLRDRQLFKWVFFRIFCCEAGEIAFPNNFWEETARRASRREKYPQLCRLETEEEVIQQMLKDINFHHSITIQYNMLLVFGTDYAFRFALVLFVRMMMKWEEDRNAVPITLRYEQCLNVNGHKKTEQRTVGVLSILIAAQQTPFKFNAADANARLEGHTYTT